MTVFYGFTQNNYLHAEGNRLQGVTGVLEGDQIGASQCPWGGGDELGLSPL
jgi:hypothetical protein